MPWSEGRPEREGDAAIPASTQYIRQVNYDCLLQYKNIVGDALKWLLAAQKHHSIAVKLNLVGPFPPEKAVTTHPAVLRLLLEALSGCGGQIRVCEDVESEACVTTTGIGTVLEDYGLAFHNLRDYGYRNVTAHNMTFAYSSLVLDSDFVIQLPKFKNHLLTNYTGAIKNMYGCISYGQRKELHRAMDMQVFSDILCAVYAIRPPDFTVMDAVAAMDGFGPTVGNPYALGYLAYGNDSVAIDRFVTGLVGYDPAELAVLETAKRMGLQKGGPDGDVVPPATSGLERAFERLPVYHGAEHARYIQILRGNFVISYDRCVGCGICVKKCPFQAITMKRSLPVIDKQRCTLCTCCIEHCPRAAINIDCGRGGAAHGAHD